MKIIFHSRILYIDLDLHHGDGVEEEFSKSKQVVTFSIHHFANGFYPGSGDSKINSNSGFNINAPLPEHVGDNDWCEIMKFGIDKIMESFDPQYVIVQEKCKKQQKFGFAVKSQKMKERFCQFLCSPLNFALLQCI